MRRARLGQRGQVVTAPARIRLVRVGENPWYEVVLTEGRNRELRKMFAAIGHFAEKIRRVEYGPLVLDMEPGKVRELTEAEVNALRLTAEGKMKPRRTKLDISLTKEAGRKKQGPREQAGRAGIARSGSHARAGSKVEAKGPGIRETRGGERPRFDKRAGGPPRTAASGRLARDRADRLARSLRLAANAGVWQVGAAVRREAESGARTGRGSTSGLVGRREQVRGFWRATE